MTDDRKRHGKELNWRRTVKMTLDAGDNGRCRSKDSIVKLTMLSFERQRRFINENKKEITQRQTIKMTTKDRLQQWTKDKKYDDYDNQWKTTPSIKGQRRRTYVNGDWRSKTTTDEQLLKWITDNNDVQKKNEVAERKWQRKRQRRQRCKRLSN